jgi:hypothetical protein
MLRKFKVTYRAVLKHRTMEIQAFSKYDAKQRFKRTYPKYEIISIEEANDEQR